MTVPATEPRWAPRWAKNGQWWAIAPPYDVVHKITWVEGGVAYVRCGARAPEGALQDPADDAVPCRLCWHGPPR